jgi:hypothetical protein
VVTTGSASSSVSSTAFTAARRRSTLRIPSVVSFD